MKSVSQCANFLIYLGVTLHKAEQPPQSIELLEKGEERKRGEKHTGTLFRRNPRITVDYSHKA